MKAVFLPYELRTFHGLGRLVGDELQYLAVLFLSLKRSQILAQLVLDCDPLALLDHMPDVAYLLWWDASLSKSGLESVKRTDSHAVLSQLFEKIGGELFGFRLREIVKKNFQDIILSGQ